MNYIKARMPNDKGVNLYIRQGGKSQLYAVAAHTNQVLVDVDKDGNEFYRPCQASIYYGQYTTWDEAVKRFKELYLKKGLAYKAEKKKNEDSKQADTNKRQQT